MLNQQLFFHQMDYKKPESQESQSEQDQQFIGQSTDKSYYITDPQIFLNFSLQDKKIKVMDQLNPIFNHVYLKDISLHKKGPLQDKAYSKINKYYKNIRRGNTLCQIYHPNQLQNKQQTYDLFFCRRGMKKFYDLQLDYLKVGATLSTYHRLMRNRIFEELEKELQTVGSTYHIYCLFKENGQHCQISYVKELQSWLFASKNVAILARAPNDLQQHYHKQRFYWAKLIAEEFFKYLELMGPDGRENFKKDIDGFTLLGQHCGNEQHQHITKYEKVEIIFYGFVKNIGSDHCQPVEECRAFLNKYGLKMSFCKEKKNLNDKNTIISTIWSMLKEVGEGTMAKQGEGSVMYIVSEREGKQRTVGMCKLKTCEYLIYRRLRQMLKLNVAKKGSTANHFQKFKFQIEQLVKHHFKPPKSLQFYFELAEKAFKECSVNGEINETYLRYKFVEFIAKFEQQQKQLKISHTTVKQQPKRVIIVCLPRLSVALQKYCKGKGYEIDYMYRAGKPATKTIIHILYMIPRLPQKLQQNCQLIIPQYAANDIDQCTIQLQQCKDLTKSQLITFIKCQDKAKNVKLFYDKIQTFRKSCIENQILFKTAPFTEEGLISAIEQLKEPLFEKEVYKMSEQKKPTKNFILPLLIPGSGKSTLCKELLSSKQSKLIWKVIDSDSIRRELMEEVENINLNNDEVNKVFFQTKNQTAKRFNQQLLKEAAIQPKETQGIYIDRIFSPFNINQTIEALISTQKPYIRIHILFQTFQLVKLNQKTYPYSLNYLLTCLKRCIERTDHKTMPNNPYLVAKIVIKFYQMMANFTIKSILKRSDQRIHEIHLSFVEDNQQTICINQQLKKKVEECLSMVEPGHQAKDCDSFIQLVQNLYKFGEFKESNNNLERYVHLVNLLEQSILNSTTLQ